MYKQKLICLFLTLIIKHPNNANAMNTQPLELRMPGMGKVIIPKNEYPSGTINLSGMGIIDISDVTIKGTLSINISGIGRIIYKHNADTRINISGIGGIYNLNKSSPSNCTICGIGSVYENTLYPRWYLTRPWLTPCALIIGLFYWLLK